MAQADEVICSPSSPITECYDFVEVTIIITKPVARNPFTDVSVSGHFSQLGQGNNVSVDGSVIRPMELFSASVLCLPNRVTMLIR
jgi:hypothetical protein